jgi:cell wall-associated NlpC family hydrolase
MRYNSWFLGMVLSIGFGVFAQQNQKTHAVAKGETISKIAKQYNVKASAIYDLNPEAKNGIKYKSILLIPSQYNSELAANNVTGSHVVIEKETLYSIAKKYSITIADIYALNPALQNTALKKGQKIKVPGKQNTVSTNPESAKVIIVEKQTEKNAAEVNSKEALNATIVREILQNDTKYAIAKEYSIAVADIDKANPILETEGLKIGQKIVIPLKSENLLTAAIRTESSSKNQVVAEIKKEIQPQGIKIERVTEEPKSTIIEDEVVTTSVRREVLSKETKYGIAKEFGITVKELERQNPKIIKGLPVGYVLNIISKKQIAPLVESVAVAVTSEKIELPYDGKTAYNSAFLDQLVSTASENIGTRYRSGGTSKEGFDCSGLMCTTFSAFDIELPRTSLEQSQYGVRISNEEAKKGDLIFFKTSRRNRINHVGMVVEVSDGDIKFIHASVSSGVIISSIKEKYYSKRVTQINRVL